MPKKHFKSQDKLDRDEPEKDRKERKKEKRNSKHQDIFDKELKAADIPTQPTEAVILSETVRKRTRTFLFLSYFILKDAILFIYPCSEHDGLPTD